MTRRNGNVMGWVVVAILVIAAVVYYRTTVGRTPPPDERSQPNLALVVGGPDAFWKIIIAGARRAAEDYNAALSVYGESPGADVQTAALARLKLDQIDGVAVSPLAPNLQTKLLSLMAAQVNLVTYDNDAPLSLRHCYIGTNNASAGRLCGELVQEALPDGGKIALFVGDVERLNARDRRSALLATLQGLLHRDFPETEDTATEDLDEPIEVGKWTVVATYLDDSNPEKALQNATKALAEHEDLDCLVGLYGYNGPACLAAVKEAGRLGEVKIVAFDEHDETLAGIAAGHIVGTVVQDPYQYGYEAVRLLCSLHRKSDAAIPMAGAGSLFLPCSKITAEEVDKYQQKLRARLESGAVPANDEAA